MSWQHHARRFLFAFDQHAFGMRFASGACCGTGVGFVQSMSNDEWPEQDHIERSFRVLHGTILYGAIGGILMAAYPAPPIVAGIATFVPNKHIQKMWDRFKTHE